MIKNQYLLVVLLSSISFQAVAESKFVTVYGKANLSAQIADEGDGNFSEIKSNASRIGLKGTKELQGGLELFYQVEYQVDLSDITDSRVLKERNQYIGLKGGFGKLMLGRNDTVLKLLHKKVDLFNDYEGDLKGLWKGENRINDTLTYYTPKIYGLTFGVTYFAEGGKKGEDGTSLGVYYGDKDLKKSWWYASFASDLNVKGYDTQSASLQVKLDNWTLGTILHRQEPYEGGESENGIIGSAQYAIDNWKIKAQIQTFEDDKSYSLGADYKLSKKAKLYVWYTDRNLEVKEDKSWLAAGVEYKF